MEVIDGQQRLRAIVAFIKGEIGAQVYLEGEWKTFWYKDMDASERRDLNLMTRVVFVDLSRQDRLRFYLRLNSGIAHTEEDLEKVRSMLVEKSE
jgi:hypothetical protein